MRTKNTQSGGGVGVVGNALISFASPEEANKKYGFPYGVLKVYLFAE